MDIVKTLHGIADNLSKYAEDKSDTIEKIANSAIAIELITKLSSCSSEKNFSQKTKKQ